MKILYDISKVLNILALLCLLGGPYGIIFTGGLQILAGVFFLIAFPKNKYIYVYFLITLIYLGTLQFGIHEIFSVTFMVPIFLLIYLSYLVHSKKLHNV